MKSTKIIISNKLFLFGSLVIATVIVTGIFLSITLKAQDQSESNEQRIKQIDKNVKEQEQMFWKISSTKIPADEGNKIVAVRRINLIYDDADSKGSTFKNKKLMYEVELFSKVNIPVTNATQYLVIGDVVLTEPFVTGDRHTIFAYVQPKQFKALKEGAIVHYLISPVQISSESIKESYNDGEPEQVAGAKFGRIDKAVGEQSPVIEEDSKTQLLRISRTSQD